MIINQNVSGGGTTPTGTTQITTNGTHDVTNYATADVQVPTTAPAYYIEKTKDANGKAVNSSYLMDLSTFTDVGNYVFYYAYIQNTSITGAVDFGSLTTVSGSEACGYMFQSCTGLTSVDLSALTTVSNNNGCNSMFQSCTGLTSVDLSSLTTVSGGYGCSSMFYGCIRLTSIDLPSLVTVSSTSGCQNMFRSCTGLTSIDLSSLTTVNGSNGCNYMFYGCTGLTSVDLPSLTTVKGSNGCTGMFYGCTNLTRVSFYALTPSSFGTQTNQFNYMLQNVIGCTVHFPMAIQSTIGSWASVTGGFSGTNTTVLFDIVTSLTGADSNTYTRSQKNSTSTATAWEYNNTLYYTAGTTEPSVNDSIFSDASCTTTETTISAIA